MANLAIVLITPGGGRRRYSRSCFTHLIPGGQERNVLSPKTQLALLWKLTNTSGRRKAPPVASPRKDFQARALDLTALATGRGRRRSEALSPPAPGKRAPAARPGTAVLRPGLSRPGKLTAEVTEAGEINDLSPKSHGGAHPPPQHSPPPLARPRAGPGRSQSGPRAGRSHRSRPLLCGAGTAAGAGSRGADGPCGLAAARPG